MCFRTLESQEADPCVCLCRLSLQVTFPASGSLSQTQVKTLEAVLPPRPMPRLTGEEEEVTLTNIDPSQVGSSEDGHAMDDEEGEGGARRVQCQNM